MIPSALCCRTYLQSEVPSGTPPLEMIQQALRHAQGERTRE